MSNQRQLLRYSRVGWGSAVTAYDPVRDCYVSHGSLLPATGILWSNFQEALVGHDLLVEDLCKECREETPYD